MLVLTLSEDDVGYISSLLEKEEKQLAAIKKSGTLEAVVCDRLIKRNSGVREILIARLIPYVCYLTDRSTKEINKLSFQDFANYFGAFPANYNESQIMSHIHQWCDENGYDSEFVRES